MPFENVGTGGVTIVSGQIIWKVAACELSAARRLESRSSESNIWTISSWDRLHSLEEILFWGGHFPLRARESISKAPTLVGVFNEQPGDCSDLPHLMGSGLDHLEGSCLMSTDGIQFVVCELNPAN